MAAPSDQTMLDNVKIAINNILAGGAVHSYQIGDRNLERMKLPELRALQKDLEARIANASTSGTRAYGSFVRPS